MLDVRTKRSEQRITDAVKAPGTTLVDVYGIGPILDTTIIDDTGDIGRFPTSGHCADDVRDRADRVLIVGSDGAPTVASGGTGR
ncbi:MAG: hypothetical protein ACK5CE_23540 [Actinomycetes bacterium]|uniref:Unannotated protein n=1 Tax=freshwater metagenome TaxID=449393 RepID=A0A6J6G581_9ZZZZ|nr:hypothetical protein [Actinomycetota bacterium]